MSFDVKEASLTEIADQINELLAEFKSRARVSLSSSSYQMFKYRCLGNCEPALSPDSEWMNDPGVDNLYDWIDKIEDNDEEEIDE